MHPKLLRSDTWITPQWIIEALGGANSFDLDPCAAPDMPWPTAKAMYTEILDGLFLEWFGRVWCNPPYSTKKVKRFMEKMADHQSGTALVFNKFETEIFQDHIFPRASALLFIRGRVRFHYMDGRMADDDGGCGSVLVAYGRHDADVLSAVPIDGAFVPLQLPNLFLIPSPPGTWDEELHRFFDRHDGPVTLAQLYRFFSTHPKSETNRHYDAKIRQVLQKGRFYRTAPGVWERKPLRQGGNP